MDAEGRIQGETVMQGSVTIYNWKEKPTGQEKLEVLLLCIKSAAGLEKGHIILDPVPGIQ